VTISPEALKRQVTEAALALGFDLCRIAPAAEAPHASVYRDWIGEGAHGEMAWLARDPGRRSDPRQVLPGARSVIVLALNYWQGPRPGDAPHGTHGSYGSYAPATGRVARYAWGDDYHDLIEARLRALGDLLAAHGGVQKPYVDTGPVLERDFAALAGAGWHGKSTMLLHPRLGTWFFLAVILTTLELPPDVPLADRCGKCTRCIDACPTAAITAPHRVDARRCISYLTIENKGPIPGEFREAIGDRIYGCDDCLDACPWNRFAAESREAAFAARSHTVGRPLRDYLDLDDDAFRRLFRGSPILRIKRRGFLRNVCVALGNVGAAGDLPALERAATDPEPLIAEHAAWAVGQIRRRLHA
jgi:epoxyqueuosine reductase